MRYVSVALVALWSFVIVYSLGELYVARADSAGTTQIPICQVEDCSDQPNQIGMWEDEDTGNWWLSVGEKSYLVEDYGWGVEFDTGAFIGGFN